MGTLFWLRRLLQVFVIAFVVIAGAQLLRGHTPADAVHQALLWAAISSGVFVAARIRQSRRGQHCALCRDTPEMRDAPPE